MALNPEQQKALAIANARKRQAEQSVPGVGVAETLGTMVSGALADPAAGVAGLATSMLTQDPAAAAAVVEGVRERLTYEPRTEAGREALQTVGEAVEPVAEALTTAEETLGEAAFEATGSPAAAAVATALPTALLEVVGLAGARGVVKGGRAVKEVSDAVDQLEGLRKVPKQADSWLFKLETPTKKAVREAIENNPTDNITAKYIMDGSGKVKADPVARNAIKQGFDEGTVAAVKGSQAADKTAMKKMVSVLEKGKANKTFAMKNRPTDVIGDSILKRFKGVKDANIQAGRELDKVAKGLKGQQVNTQGAVSRFLDDLEDMGVTVDEDFKPSFAGSDIEGVPAAENAIKKVTSRLKQVSESGDAYNAHRMKKFIDEQVSYGKVGEGLTGKTENVVKGLRRNIDSALDSEFSDYNQVNTQFADTRTALDNFQSAAGTNFDPFSPGADKFVGTLSRRLMSNVQSRVKLMDSISGLEDVGRKYGKTFNDDVFTQAMFADELENVFGSFAPTSLQGAIEKGTTQAITGGAREAAIGTAVDIGKRLTGKTEDKALKSIKKLLTNGGK